MLWASLSCDWCLLQYHRTCSCRVSPFNFESLTLNVYLPHCKPPGHLNVLYQDRWMEELEHWFGIPIAVIMAPQMLESHFRHPFYFHSQINSLEVIMQVHRFLLSFQLIFWRCTDNEDTESYDVLCLHQGFVHIFNLVFLRVCLPINSALQQA